MDLKILDLVSTKLLSKKLAEEINLEILVNNPPNTLSAEELSDKIIEKVSVVRNYVADLQAWESIISQMTKGQNGENNKQ